MLTIPKSPQQQNTHWQHVLAPETTKHLASIYRRTGPMSSTVSKMANHADLMALSRQPQIPYITQRLLQRFVCHSMKSAPQHQKEQVHINPRVFLSGYMMLFFPNQSMDPTAKPSVVVRAKAEAVIQRFEQIIYALDTRASLAHLPATLTQGFHTLVSNYNQAFSTWRAHDSERLIAHLRFERIALQNAQNITPADQTELRQEIQRNIEIARNKVRVLGGQSALDEMDREMTATYTEPDPSLSTLPLEQPSNEHIAHAVLLNPEFKFHSTHDLSVNRRLQHEVDAGYRRAYWNRVVYELDRGSFMGARTAMEKIAISLNGLDHPLPFDGCDTLCSEHFDRQSAEELVMRIKEHMRPLIATHREHEVQTGWEAVEKSGSIGKWFAAALEFFVGCINLVNIDQANARLQAIVPSILSDGANYERNRFAAKLAEGSITLERTAEWIKQSVANVPSAVQHSLQAGRPEAYIAVQMEGLQRLVLGDGLDLSPQAAPEILMLDAVYLAHMREELHSIAIGTAAHIHATRVLHTGPALDRLRKWLANHSFNLKDAAAELDSLDIPSKQKASLEAAFRQIVNPGDALLNVVAKRIRGIWRRLVDGQTLEGNDEVYVNVHTERLNAAVAMLIKIATLSRQVHFERYNALIQGAIHNLN